MTNTIAEIEITKTTYCDCFLHLFYPRDWNEISSQWTRMSDRLHPSQLIPLTAILPLNTFKTIAQEDSEILYIRRNKAIDFCWFVFEAKMQFELEEVVGRNVTSELISEAQKLLQMRDLAMML